LRFSQKFFIGAFGGGGIVSLTVVNEGLAEHIIAVFAPFCAGETKR
jgi:hypothetical protein